MLGASIGSRCAFAARYAARVAVLTAATIGLATVVACGRGPTDRSPTSGATVSPGVTTPAAVPLETDLGTLGGDSSATLPAAVSDNIDVGQAQTADNETHAFAYDLGAASPKMLDLGGLGASGNPGFPRSSATDISGSIVVGYSVAAGGLPHAFSYDLRTTPPVMRDLGTLGTAPTSRSSHGGWGGPNSYATAVSGNIVLGSSDGHSFIYDLAATSPSMRDLGAPLDTGNATITGISGDTLVGFLSTPGPERDQYFYTAFAYELGGHSTRLRDLGNLGGTQTKALAVSGHIVVGVSNGHAFSYDLRASRPKMRDLGTLGCARSEALAVSGTTVLGDSCTASSQDVHAFAYDLGAASPRMLDLGRLGDRNTHVSAADGPVMAGYWSTMPDGSSHAVAWNLAKAAAPPGAPTALSGQPGDRSVTLSWVAPDSNGGSHITGYRVTPYLGGMAQPAANFTTAATTETVAGLVNGRAYTFTVAATTAAGTGAPSAESAALSPSVAGATAPHSPGVCTGTQVPFYKGGYWLATKKGAVVGFNAPSCGSLAGQKLSAPVAGMAYNSANGGYWVVTADGAVYSFGPGTPDYGSLAGQKLTAPVVAMSATRDAHGYWLVTSNGDVFDFGDAGAYGSMAGRNLTAPVVGIAPTADGAGFWLATSNGDVFDFGDAGAYGSVAGRNLTAPVVGIAPTADGAGYWLATSNGDVFSFGSAQSFGPWAGKPRQAPVVGIASDPAAGGMGYWLVTSAGEVFSVSPFGATNFQSIDGPVVAIASIAAESS